MGVFTLGGCCPDGSLPNSMGVCPVPGDDGADDAGDAGDGADAGGTIECDQFEQDCPPDQKCALVASSDSTFWDSALCVPLAAEPQPNGAPCTAETPTSGLDNCDVGSMCVSIDIEVGEGFCASMAIQVSAEEVACEQEGLVPVMQDSSSITLCLPQCDPLTQNCATGEACYPIGEEWTCAPDASGEAGVYGDACEFVNVCDPGLICLGAAATPGCAGSAGCCTEICDLSDPAGDAQCMGAAGGQTCQAWYEEGSAPAGYEDVGACALPA